MQRLLHNTLYTEIITIFFFLVLVFFVASIIRNRFREIKDYDFLYKAIFFKSLGVLFFCCVYIFYYKGGDTINYFLGSRSLANLLENNFSKGISILFNTDSPHNSWNSFPSHDHPPYYMWKDPNTFAVSRYTLPLYFIGCKSFLATSLLTSCFSLFGIWKVFRLFNILYPGNTRVFAYLILYLPTLIFWGGGIMKDSYVLGATCWITYNFYMIFIKRKKLFFNVIFFIMNLFLIVTIKSYIILSLIPGMLLWINSAYLKNIQNGLVKLFVFPLLAVFIIFIGITSFENLSSLMGVYGDMDTAIQQAQVIQEDLLREDQYGGNNYNIGQLDGSLGGLLSVAPLAIFTALFRPLFWEIGSPTMVLSVVENTIMIIFTFVILIRTSPIKLMKILGREPFLLYCFIFSIVFAFGVGIAGTNFGALVRYKTPLVPFFFSTIYLIYKLTRIRDI